MCTGFEHYLLTLNGALKVLHTAFGAISLALLSYKFVAVREEILLVCVVGVVLVLSFVYLLAYMKWELLLLSSDTNKKIDFAYHIIAGLGLIIVGTYVTSWTDYYETCHEDCPSLYTKGVAKILTFVNGVLYGIVAFLNVKEDEITKEDELTDSDLEDFPLITIQTRKKKSRFTRPSYSDSEYQSINP